MMHARSRCAAPSSRCTCGTSGCSSPASSSRSAARGCRRSRSAGSCCTSRTTAASPVGLAIALQFLPDAAVRRVGRRDRRPLRQAHGAARHAGRHGRRWPCCSPCSTSRASCSSGCSTCSCSCSAWRWRSTTRPGSRSCPSWCRRTISPTRSGSAAPSSSSRASSVPPSAGVLIVAVGTGVCFALNAVSFVFVIVALLMMRTERAAPRRAPLGREKGQIRDGLRYIWHTAELRSIAPAHARRRHASRSTPRSSCRCWPRSRSTATPRSTAG